MAEKLEIIIGAKDQFSGAFNKLTGMLPSVKQLAIGAGAAVAGVGTSLYAMAKTTATTYDQTRKFADQLGLSTEFLSKYGLAAEFSGVQQETFNKSIQKLQVGIGETARGTGIAKEAFDDLGISIYDTQGKLKTSEDILPELAEKFGNLANATQRAELASKLFGQRGISLLQMFKDGKQGLDAMTAEAEKFGLVISEKAANNAAEFNDSLTRMLGSFKGVKNAIAEQIMPVIAGLQNRFADFVANNRPLIVGWVESLLSGIATAVQYTAYGVAGMIDAWRGLQMIWEVLKIAFATFSEYLNKTIIWIVDKFQWMLERINFRGIFDADIALLRNVKDNVGGAINEIVAMKAAATDALNKLIVESTAISDVDQLVERIKKAIEEIRAAGTSAAGEKGATDEDRGGESSFIVPPQSKLDEEIARSLAAYEEMQDGWDEYNENNYQNVAAIFGGLEEQASIFGGLIDQTFQKVTDGIAQAAGAAIFAGSSMGDMIKSLYKSVLQTVVVTLIKLGIERLILMAKNIVAGTTENITRMGQLAQQTYAGAFAATAAIPIVGPALAPAVASASTATMLAGSTGAAGAGMAAGAAHGGLEMVPKEQTYLLDKGERVLSPNQNQDLIDFMKTAGRSITINLTVNTQENLEGVDWNRLTENEIRPALLKLTEAGFPV